MNMAAGGSVLVIVVFLALDDPSKDFGDEYQPDTADEPVDREKFGDGFPWEVTEFGNEEINNQQDTQGNVKIQAHFCPVFRRIQKCDFLVWFHDKFL